ncbi:MAG: multidrug ABC transporter ATPase [Epsilonproteobacteria bacterium (ex Lamellibrachia satsuma)]|nr:MAG: multidrug ABC transporter ATPase [Epsilonproteobacteria bacterium (ex Lamellibrachia satsuma)]
MNIKVSNVTKKYGDLKALDNLSLEIKQGTIFGLLGINGAGKSTLLSILNGLTDIDAGTIDVLGFDIKKDKKKIKEISSIVPQNLAFYEKLTVKENLDFFADIQNATRENYNKAIEISDLSKILNQEASTLSGGQKRKLNMAIGILNDPQIIYFDEPTVGIDPKSRNEILDSIKQYKNLGITVVYTSHYMNEIEKICDEVAIISKGKLIEQDRLENLLSDRISGQILIEIVYENGIELDEFTVKDNSFIETTKDRLCEVLEKLDQNNISVKQIKYSTTDLEKHFLELTDEAEDV